MSDSRSAPFYGVQRLRLGASPRTGSREWGARVLVAGKLYHLGSYQHALDAAYAFDNAAYWLSRENFYQPRRLNCPENYTREGIPPPPPSTKTLTVLEQVRARCVDGVLRPEPRISAPPVQKIKSLLNEAHAKLNQIEELLKNEHPES